MPLVAHANLPIFDRLKKDGYDILDRDRAAKQDIRELHIGLLNMMPDSALKATERQFFRLLTSSNKIAQFYIHPFTLPSIERHGEYKAYVDEYYETFDDIKNNGLDALIITGANPSQPNLYEEKYWQEMIEVFQWAQKTVPSTLCSCLASHSAFKLFHNIDRKPLEQKLWGVYSHRIVHEHPLVANINSRFDVPHSRYNQVSCEQLEQAGLKVLVRSNQAGVHIATSTDLFRVIYFQGHPEYNLNSLLKEYKREITRFYADQRVDYPPVPENYFNPEALGLLKQHQQNVEHAKQQSLPMPELDEAAIEAHIDCTWWDTAKAIFNNWLGLVYQTTHVDPHKLFMDGIDPNNPLNL